jgi:hypothetical protein
LKKSIEYRWFGPTPVRAGRGYLPVRKNFYQHFAANNVKAANSMGVFGATIIAIAW